MNARDPLPGALLIGFAAVAFVAMLRRAGARQAGELGPLGPATLEAVTVTPGAPLVLSGDFGITAPPTVFDRVSMFLGDAVDKLKALALPRGIRNLNPGNIRTLPADRAWNGQIGDDKGYGIYSDMAHGVRALGKQLLAYHRRGISTVRAIIGTWAPPSENITQSYVDVVARALKVAPDALLDVEARLPELAAAIIHHENGGAFESFRSPGMDQNYTREQLARWVRLP